MNNKTKLEVVNEKYLEMFQEGNKLSRIWQHLEDNRPFGIITAFRVNGELSQSENLKLNRTNNRKLAKSIQDAGFGFWRLEGVWLQNKGTEEEVESPEDVFFVSGGLEDTKKLKSFLVNAGKKWEQDSILFRDNKNNTILYGTNSAGYPGLDKEDSLGKWKPSKVGEFYSKTKSGTFVFEGIIDLPSGLSMMSENARKIIHNRLY